MDVGPITGSSHEPVGDAEVTTEIWFCLCCTDMHLRLHRICLSRCFALRSRLRVMCGCFSWLLIHRMNLNSINNGNREHLMGLRAGPGELMCVPLSAWSEGWG